MDVGLGKLCLKCCDFLFLLDVFGLGGMSTLAELADCFQSFGMFYVYVGNGAGNAVVIIGISLGVGSLLGVMLQFLVGLFEMSWSLCPSLLMFLESIPFLNCLFIFWAFLKANNETVGQAFVGDFVGIIPGGCEFYFLETTDEVFDGCGLLEWLKELFFVFFYFAWSEAPVCFDEAGNDVTVADVAKYCSPGRIFGELEFVGHGRIKTLTDVFFVDVKVIPFCKSPLIGIFGFCLLNFRWECTILLICW